MSATRTADISLRCSSTKPNPLTLSNLEDVTLGVHGVADDEARALAMLGEDLAAQRRGGCANSSKTRTDPVAHLLQQARRRLARLQRWLRRTINNSSVADRNPIHHLRRATGTPPKTDLASQIPHLLHQNMPKVPSLSLNQPHKPATLTSPAGICLGGESTFLRGICSQIAA